MKLLEVPLLALSLASRLAPVAATGAAPGASGLLVLRDRNSLAVRSKGEPENLHFGDSACPCIGFDNIRGETTVVLDDGAEVAYPADLGARCEKWDDGVHSACKEGQTPGFGNGWCAQSWCFVDPCNCDIPVMPKMTKYVPDARFLGKPLYWSYATCGGEDMFSDELPEIGAAGCRCIGFDNIPGETEIVVPGDDRRPDQVVLYPAEIGGTCKAWDHKVHPECTKGAESPSWCQQRWCYVDPCSCSLKAPPKVTTYLPDATFAGKSLYYSYETCGHADTFTKTYNIHACVNQDSEEKCLKLESKDGAQKCAWIGSSCLGAELVSHPSCTKLIEKKQHVSAKSGSVTALVGNRLLTLAAAALALIVAL
eukprot:CAMPEP_0203861892 /NCGR_PEP_ID=MMETSP0359-20131031/13278_1 /ASSEMBLY_ACC=CAM_ASM_000338 /TAXON_ID=268821 /ORGANISM="Scrippsiella Hangoei, Strain SHTV-5" /LENGTH=366 /DNA_ID=CAMNT_0050779205 /DNA_START=54 /DNA_END=1154 /DNA_ORIENTATION=+